MNNYSISQYGKPLDKSKYTIDEYTKTFSSDENDLVLDFHNLDNCTFKTGSCCTFKAGSCCTFKAGSYCTFKAGSYCTFNTGSNCTFDTGSDCTFDTWSYCTFKAGSDCTFKTWSNCTFKTGNDCTFKTGNDCVVVRRDIYEVIELTENKKIKLNGYGIKGFTDMEDKEELTLKQVCKELGRDIKIIK